MAGTLIAEYWKLYTATMNSAGNMQAQTDQVPADETWYAGPIALAANPYVACQCLLYHGDPIPSNFINASQDGGLDTYEGTLLIPGGAVLTFVWIGGVGSSVLTARPFLQRLKNAPANFDHSLATWRGPR